MTPSHSTRLRELVEHLAEIKLAEGQVMAEIYALLPLRDSSPVTPEELYPATATPASPAPAAAAPKKKRHRRANPGELPVAGTLNAIILDGFAKFGGTPVPEELWTYVSKHRPQTTKEVLRASLHSLAARKLLVRPEGSVYFQLPPTEPALPPAEPALAAE